MSSSKSESGKPESHQSEYLKPSMPSTSFSTEGPLIPPRGASLYHAHATPEEKQNFGEIEDKAQNLKQNVSDLSLRTGTKREISMEYLDTRKSLVREHTRSQKSLLGIYQRLHKEQKISDVEFRNLAENCWTTRAKLTQEDLTLDRDRERILDILEVKEKGDIEGAYAALFTQIYKNDEATNEWEKRKNFRIYDEKSKKYWTEKDWSRELKVHYNAHDPEKPEDLWCPITRAYGPKNTRTMAHIVPHNLGWKNVGYMFGEPDKGRDLIWSMGNAMVMNSVLERGFDRGYFVLLPLETKPGEPSEWQAWLLATDKAKDRIDAFGQVSWADIHKRRLEWKNNNRPAHRCLYYHFISNILRYVRYEKEDWAKHFLTLPTGNMWATPGPYLRKSMLRVLAQTIGDMYEMPKELYEHKTFDGKDDEPEAEEKKKAAEMFTITERLKKKIEEEGEMEEEEEWKGFED